MSAPLKPVYLFSGDEFLVRQAAERLVDAHVPESSRDFNLTLLDGASTDASTIARHLAQVPMFRGTKLVVVHDTTLLTGKADLSGEVERAAQLWSDGKKKDAAKRMLGVLGRARWSLDDLGSAPASRWTKDLGVTLGDLEDGFVDGVREVASEAGWSVPEAETETLERLLSGGAPEGNVLVLTCLKPDRRLALTKFIEKQGEHERLVAERTGRTIETLDIGEVTRAVLERHGKKLDRGAETLLKRAIGGEMRLLSAELEKACLYVGEKKTITARDLEEVGVSRVREEDYWELGSAVTSRDLAASLWYAHDAFDHRQHPIRIVAGIAGALRRALQVRAVADRHGVRPGTRNLPDAVVSEVAGIRGGRKPHPFALLKEWERSRTWASQTEMSAALAACRDADLLLKSSGGDGRLIVERLLFQLCGAAR